MKKIAALSLGLLMLSAASAYADNTKAVIHQIELMGARVISTFPSTAKGYTAIMAEKDGKKKMFYSTPDGHMVYGLLFNSSGESLTAMDVINASNPKSPKMTPQNVSKAAPQPVELTEIEPEYSQENIRKAYELAKKAPQVTEGVGKDVYVVFDPNCPYCKALFSKTRAHLKTSKIHWIPIGLIGQDSPAKSAKILESKASEIAVISAGGVKLPQVTPQIEMKLTNNAKILETSESTSVPTIFHVDGGILKMISGMPSEQDVAKVFGK